MYFGNFNNELLFTPSSYWLEESKSWSKEVPDLDKVNKFTKFCKENNFIKHESGELKENEYLLCEGPRLLCYSKDIALKMHKFLESNIPPKEIIIEWNN